MADAVRQGLFTELGAGSLDLDGVLVALAARSYDGWLMVEQDRGLGPPSESAAIGRRVLAASLRRLGADQAGAGTRVRIALLGAGRIGRLHARLLKATPGVDGVVVGDVDADRALDVAQTVGIESAPTIDAALDGAGAVVIAAATTAHPELIRESIGRGLPTFCEKPLAATLDDTIALAADIDRSGIPFQLGFQRRFDPAYREVHRLIRNGSLGTLYAIRLAGHDPAPAHEAYIAQSGGLFRDFSIHDFDILRWMTGCEVEEVYADGGVRGFPVFEKYGDVDTAVVTLRLTDGPFTVMTVARHDPLGYDIRAEIFGSRRQRRRRARSPNPPALGRTGRAPAGRTGVEGLPRALRIGLRGRVRGLRRARPRRCSQSLYGPRRCRGSPRRRSGRSLAPRTPTSAARGDPRLRTGHGRPWDGRTKGGVHGGHVGRGSTAIPRLHPSGG